MRRILSFLFLLMGLMSVSDVEASSKQLSLDLKSLDSCIMDRPQNDARVERNLQKLKQQLAFSGSNHRRRMQLLDKIMSDYYYYQFDSALVYVKKYYAEAVAAHDNDGAIRAQLRKAELLANGGFYNVAEDILRRYDFHSLPESLKFDYAIAAYWTYVYWSAFTMDAEFTTRIDSLRMKSLNAALRYSKHGTPFWYYLLGERSYFLNEYPQKSIKYYNECLHRIHGYCRLYSQATFAIARAYKQLHRNDMYGYYLLQSAKGDQLASVKENAALQDLAMYIFSLDHDKASLAHHYLSVALDDATFYNNKLRKLEISNRLPPIVTAYQQEIKTGSRKLWGLVVLAVLFAIGAISLYLISHRRNAQLHLSQKLLEHKNSQLHAVNAQMQDVNAELKHVNVLLRDANRKREEYLRLFVDICASTMDRIVSYRKLVQLKIKANQTADLLKTVNSDRTYNRDMAQFFVQFDKAFLGLYPDFVTQFSNLLQPEYRVTLNKDGSLSTELRIFAFIRLGVKESSEIATLLSYSPHTIYNYRSAMKSHAIDKEHFEENVCNLCKPS